MDVDVDEGGHQELTVEPVHDAAVSGDDVAKVLDLEGPLEPASEEATERPDHRGEDGHEKCVEQERIDGYRLLHSQLKKINMESLSSYDILEFVYHSPDGGHCLRQSKLLRLERPRRLAVGVRHPPELIVKFCNNFMSFNLEHKQSS